MRLRRLAAIPAVLLLACQEGDPVALAPAPLPPVGGLAMQQDDQWIVVLEESSSPRVDAYRLAATQGAVPQRVFEHALKGFAVSLPAPAAAALARMPGVRRVEPDLVMSIVATQNSATWGLDRIDQRALPLGSTYSYNNEGSGVNAYILDTGIRYDHTEFHTSSSNSTSRASLGIDVMSDSATYRGADCHGHGTHVAGTVGGRLYGVAKSVRLYAVRVLGCTGSGATSGIIAALDWMVQHHVAGVPAVGNMSLGGGFSQSLNDAVQRTISDGIVMAVAAGNSSADACSYSPASAPNAITLGATTASDARASFSNFGNCVDFFAPGSGITSASYASTTGTASFSGTSMASPHAAGAAALYLGATPAATPQQVRDGLFAMSTKGVVTGSNTTNNHLLYTFDIGGAGSPPPNAAPTAAFTVSCSLLSCTFVDGSSDSDGSIAQRAWTFGDGGTSSVAAPAHSYAAGGTYTVQLTVTDDDGATASTTRQVTVSSAPANIVLSASKRTKGSFRVDLTWTGAQASSIDVYRNGVRVTTVANSGTYSDALGKKRGTYSHQVCHAGTTTCSNTTSVTF